MSDRAGPERTGKRHGSGASPAAGRRRRLAGKKPVLFILAFGALAAGLRGQASLFFLEAQAVAAYSSAAGRLQPFSLAADDVMQKPSLGFDYVKKISGRTRDVGTLAIQARAAYDEGRTSRVELQLYNAYFKLKAGFADAWAGHSRPALGLASVLDSHALLLPTLAMMGYGFDRDWGAGLSRDFSWGQAAASVTAGSGMGLRLDGNVLVAARISGGVLDRDNFSLGLSAAAGDVLETMGYKLMEGGPVPFRCLSLDGSHRWRNLETRAEILAGEKNGRDVLALFGRLGVLFLDEGRLRVDFQPVALRAAGEWETRLAAGLSYQATADLALRGLVLRDSGRRDTRVVLQVYFYKPL